MARSLEASNLGQIIGRMLYAGVEAQLPAAFVAPDVVPIPPPPPTKAPHGRRRNQVLTLLEGGEFTRAEIAERTGLNLTYLSVLLCELQDDGLVISIRDERPYRYKLAPAS